MKQKNLGKDIRNNIGVIVNIRGSNASGKSTIVKQFIDCYGGKVIKLGDSYVTFIEKLNIYVLGRYDVSSGGCDRYSGKDEVYEIINKLVKLYKPLAIIYEGMLYGKTFKFSYLLALYAKRNFYNFVCVTLIRKFENVIKLLEERNGGSDFNTASVLRVYESVVASSKKLKLSGVKVYFVDVDGVKKENMFRILKNVLEKEGVCFGKVES